MNKKRRFFTHGHAALLCALLLAALTLLPAMAMAEPEVASPLADADISWFFYAPDAERTFNTQTYWDVYHQGVGGTHNGSDLTLSSSTDGAAVQSAATGDALQRGTLDLRIDYETGINANYIQYQDQNVNYSDGSYTIVGLGGNWNHGWSTSFDIWIKATDENFYQYLTIKSYNDWGEVTAEYTLDPTETLISGYRKYTAITSSLNTSRPTQGMKFYFTSSEEHLGTIWISKINVNGYDFWYQNDPDSPFDSIANGERQNFTSVPDNTQKLIDSSNSSIYPLLRPETSINNDKTNSGWNIGHGSNDDNWQMWTMSTSDANIVNINGENSYMNSIDTHQALEIKYTKKTENVVDSTTYAYLDNGNSCSGEWLVMTVGGDVDLGTKITLLKGNSEVKTLHISDFVTEKKLWGASFVNDEVIEDMKSGCQTIYYHVQDSELEFDSVHFDFGDIAASETDKARRMFVKEIYAVKPKVEFTKTVAPGSDSNNRLYYGDTLTYTLKIKNAKDTFQVDCPIHHFEVTDALPTDYVELVGPVPSGLTLNISTNSIEWNWTAQNENELLTAQQEKEISFNVKIKINRIAEFTNTATLTKVNENTPNEQKTAITYVGVYTSVTASCGWNKNLTGRPVTENDSVTFKVEAVDNAPLPLSILSSNGIVTFPLKASNGDSNGSTTSYTLTGFSFDKPGRYVYRISEQKPTPAEQNMTYDTNVLQVTFVVEPDPNNSSSFKQPYASYVMIDDKGTQTYPSTPTFVNQFALPKGSLKIEKQIYVNGRQIQINDVPNDVQNELGFFLRKDGNSTPVVTHALIQGTATHDNIIAGTYTLSEENTDIPGLTLVNTTWTNNSTSADVTDPNDKQQISVTIEGGKTADFTIKNYYAYTPVSADCSWTKVLEGRAPEENETVTFEIEAQNDAPLPSGITGGTFTRALTGDTTLCELTGFSFNKPGTYTYTITEVAGGKPGITYDAVPLTVTFNVGTKSNSFELTVTSVTYKKGDADTDKPAFTNTFSGSLTIVKRFDVKSGDPDAVKRIDPTFTIAYPNGTVKTVKYSEFTETESGKACTLTGLAAGEYTVTENAAGVDGYSLTLIVDDKQEGSVTEEDGVLTVPVDGNHVDVVLDLTNEYTQDVGSLTITKITEGDHETPADTEFTITHKDNKYTKTVKYSDFTDGKYTFANIPVGEYIVTESENAIVKGYGLNATISAGYIVTLGKTLEVTITNTYTRQTGSLTITKKTTGGTTPDKTEFTVTGPDGYSKTVKFGEFTDGKYILSDLPVGKYKVTENTDTAKVTNYSLSVPGNGSEAAVLAGKNTDVTITNIYNYIPPVTPVETINYTFKKIWRDGGAADRPTSITYRIVREDDAGYVDRNNKVSVTDKGVKVDGDTWTWTKALQPNHTYTATEIDVPAGYVSECVVDGTTITIINTRVPETGDSSNLPLYGALLIVSLAGLALLYAKKKRKES